MVDKIIEALKLLNGDHGTVDANNGNIVKLVKNFQ